MDFKGKNCPVCSEKFKEDDDVVVCPKCGAPYHRDCYAEKGKCIFPELHKEGKAWKSTLTDEDDKDIEENNEDDENLVVCRHCGHKNSKDSIVCEKCGDFLTAPTFIGNFSDMDEEDFENFKEQMRNASPIFQNGNFYVNGVSPYNFGIDKDEDFEGASVEEVSHFVGSNSLYYLPVFSRIKKFNTSRFNFAAFIFGGGWFFYRKQYLKGTLITLFTMVVTIGQSFVDYFWANELFENLEKAMSESGITPSYTEYYNWITQNYSTQQIAIMCLPTVFWLIRLAIIIFCGLFANRGYYKHTVKSIKKVKDKNPDPEKKKLLEKLTQKGNVKPGLAVMLITCENIICMAAAYFFTTIK
ncbi:MAG: DUF2628 domain-containing protein [Clostridia bacterium]|nr:DUF2628 domain-containing protein [Clostridia bacterium]